MGDCGEAVHSGFLVSPALDGGFGDFDGVAAAAADKVVVVFFALAPAVLGFAVLAAKGVNFTFADHGLQEPVDRGQGEGLPGVQQLGVQLLRALELGGAFQHLFQC